MFKLIFIMSRVNITLKIAVVSALLLTGCVSRSDKISDVRIGMPKDEVLKVMGPPKSTSAQDRAEYLIYFLFEQVSPIGSGGYWRYYVRLVDGKVESFGRFGDFDTIKTPTLRTESTSRVTAEVFSSEKKDIATELQKLKALKDAGALTEDEFARAKQKLLSQ